MASLAIRKIRPAESLLIVMTAAAAERIFRRKVHRSKRRIDLISTRRARVDGVAGRAFIIGKLRRMTARARQMTGKFRSRRIVCALVAKGARKAGVFRV